MDDNDRRDRGNHRNHNALRTQTGHSTPRSDNSLDRALRLQSTSNEASSGEDLAARLGLRALKALKLGGPLQDLAPQTLTLLIERRKQGLGVVQGLRMIATSGMGVQSEV